LREFFVGQRTTAFKGGNQGHDKSRSCVKDGAERATKRFMAHFVEKANLMALELVQGHIAVLSEKTNASGPESSDEVKNAEHSNVYGPLNIFLSVRRQEDFVKFIPV
jgi:hypothetical protein